MKKNDGRFKKGEHRSPGTEFKKGQHWREPKPFWKKEWLYKEYIDKQRSASDIGKQFGITEAAIFFWLRKHGIPARSMVEIRKNKKWGLSGSQNGMYGRRGLDASNWRGGCTPDRQAFYSSEEWSKASQLIWKRDHGVCQRCGIKNTKMHIHHILSFSIKETRSDTSNLILLCVKCHRFVHSRKNTEMEFVKKEVENV